MSFVPANPDVGGLLEPGIFTSFNFTGSGAAITNTNRSAHLVGYRLSTGAGVADTPSLYTQQSDVDADHGQGSEISRLFAAFVSQNGPGTGEIWCTGITPPSGGTASTYALTFAGPATATGMITVSVSGYALSTSVASGDTATIVATNLYGARNALANSPVSVTDSGSGTLTFTYRHKGITGEDCPIVYHQDSATGITASSGTLTYSTAPSGSAGSATVTVGSFVFTVAIDPAVETTAALVATKVYNAINSASPPGPVTATNPTSGVVTLFPRNDRVQRRISAAIVTTGGVTVAASLSGTTGAGTPTLTAALTAAAALNRGFASWATSFSDSTSLGTYETHLEAEGNGVVQKNQCLFVGSAAKLATAGSLITGASPSPTAMLNSGCALYWCREAPQQAFELAARYAAAYLKSEYFPQNLDGVRLTTRGSVPLGVPHLVDRPNRADREAAMGSYYMTVGMVDSAGYLTIERAITTSNASNQDLHDLTTVRQVHTARPDLNQYLVDRFAGKSLRVTGVPKTSYTVTPTSVRDACFSWASGLDDQDRYDGAETWKTSISCIVDPAIATRLRIFVPYALIRSLHQITPVIQPV